MKKKLLALVMSFTVVLSLAACGGGPDAARTAIPDQRTEAARP